MKYHFAQLNIARLAMPYEHPDMADFVNNLDRINAIAEQSKGFIWRYTEPDNQASSAVFGADMLVNMSLWTDKDALMRFTYQSEHVSIYKRRKEWFQKMETPHMVCWFVPEGHIPALGEARSRLDHLARYGETPWAFTFRKAFSAAQAEQYTPVKAYRS